MRKLKGFTLIELMIVMAVIAILATMALVGFRTAQMAARDTERAQVVRGIQVALECFLGDTGTYPAAVDCASPVAALPGCWTGVVPLDPLGGGFASCAGCSCTYVGGTTDYTITLIGERGGAGQVFVSPQ